VRHAGRHPDRIRDAFRLRARCWAITLLSVTTPAAAAPHSYTVVVDKLRFGSLPTGLRVGDTIVRVNKEFLRHSAIAADHSVNVDLPPNATAKMTFRASGSFPFVCRYHPAMRGILLVGK
jgi:plastocyanin